jgi:hypothetical protein
MFFDMGFYRQEILLDEFGGLRILVRLDIQPSTSPSNRRSAEIDQDRPILLLRGDEGLICIFNPIDSHGDLLGDNKNYRRGYSIAADECSLAWSMGK